MSDVPSDFQKIFETASLQSGICLLCQKPVAFLVAYPHVKACLAKYEAAFMIGEYFETSPQKRTRESAVIIAETTPNVPQPAVTVVQTTTTQQVQPVAQAPAPVAPTASPIVHRCDLGTNLCPRPDTNTKKSVTFQFADRTATICKFQHLKSNVAPAFLEEKYLNVSPIAVERAIFCFGCRRDSLTKVSVYCRNRIALHEFCSLKCAVFILALYKQQDWERAVEKNEPLPPSSTGIRQ